MLQLIMRLALEMCRALFPSLDLGSEMARVNINRHLLDVAATGTRGICRTVCIKMRMK